MKKYFLKFLKFVNEKRKNFKIIIFFSILMVVFYLYLEYLITFKNYWEIKVCLCSLGKNENKYAIEFIEHYKNYKIDKIFIFDNNDINGEMFENVLSDYIKNEFVKIINYRGKMHPQLDVLRECYKINYKAYNWIIMYDMDEFINLKNIKNIKIFLNDEKFMYCKIICLNRAFHTDNNQIYYKNKSLNERFPDVIKNVYSAKPILRGNISNIDINNNHIINHKYKLCNGFGHKNDNRYDFEYYYIDHYYFKSTEEFIDKINRGDSFYNNTYDLKFLKIKYYFEINKITLEKINYIEKNTGINLTSIRNNTKNISY